MHGVRSRKVHDVDGIVRMHLMWRRKVFNRCGSLRCIDMSPLFDRILLACGEVNLPLQCGLVGTRWQWRPVHGVRSKKVQDVDRINRVHPLSRKLLLSCGEFNVNKLHL